MCAFVVLFGIIDRVVGEFCFSYSKDLFLLALVVFSCYAVYIDMMSCKIAYISVIFYDILHSSYCFMMSCIFSGHLRHAKVRRREIG